MQTGSNKINIFYFEALKTIEGESILQCSQFNTWSLFMYISKSLENCSRSIGMASEWWGVQRNGQCNEIVVVYFVVLLIKELTQTNPQQAFIYLMLVYCRQNYRGKSRT